ncbi:MAG TPA: hypothetical protein VM368_05035, partial [Flavisolibacter sp.]|nr:hypothetical protein [Flavisolibacter sp.]
FNNRKFNGDFNIKDPNAELTLNGLIDLSGTHPIFNATADIVNANLKALQLNEKDINLKGLFKLNLQGSNLSNLLGTARISDGTLLYEGKRLQFDSLYVFANYINGVRTLKAVSNEFDLTVNGDFDLASLPNAFTLFLSRYYPAYIKAPNQVKPQSFTFDLTTGIVEDYLKILDERLGGFNNSRITGSLDVAANAMTIDANVPYFSYNNNEFSDVVLKGQGDFQKLSLSGEVLNAVVDSSIILPQTNFTIEAQNDVSNISIQTTSNQAINVANLSAQIRTFDDGVTVHVNPSTFVLNEKKWNIDQGGELNFRRNNILQGQLVLREAQQEIVIHSTPSSIGNWHDLQVNIRKLNIGDLSPLFIKGTRLEGILSGNVLLENPTKSLYVTTNLQAEQVRLDNDSLGTLNFNLTYDNKTGILAGKGRNADPEHQIDFNLLLNILGDANYQNRITLRPNNFQINILERFLGDLFSNIYGYATGTVDILSKGKEQDYLAKVKLRDAGLTVNFSKVAYTIED